MAGLNHTMKLIELSDLKISKLLTDDGTATTYGTVVDLPGAMKITLSPKADSKQLRGDSILVDVYTKITEVELDVECSMFNLDALPVLMGGTVVDSGTTPAQKTTFSLAATNTTPGYFKIEGQWTYVNIGTGDAHVILYKCKITDAPSFEINDASGNFGTLKFKGLALPTIYNGNWYDLVLNETKTAIGAGSGE